jgi:hypothetical protein
MGVSASHHHHATRSITSPLQNNCITTKAAGVVFLHLRGLCEEEAEACLACVQLGPWCLSKRRDEGGGGGGEGGKSGWVCASCSHHTEHDLWCVLSRSAIRRP